MGGVGYFFVGVCLREMNDVQQETELEENLIRMGLKMDFLIL